MLITQNRKSHYNFQRGKVTFKGEVPYENKAYPILPLNLPSSEGRSSAICLHPAVQVIVPATPAHYSPLHLNWGSIYPTVAQHQASGEGYLCGAL